jgi:hypothetical protein
LAVKLLKIRRDRFNRPFRKILPDKNDDRPLFEQQAAYRLFELFGIIRPSLPLGNLLCPGCYFVQGPI